MSDNTQIKIIIKVYNFIMYVRLLCIYIQHQEWGNCGTRNRIKRYGLFGVTNGFIICPFMVHFSKIFKLTIFILSQYHYLTFSAHSWYLFTVNTHTFLSQSHLIESQVARCKQIHFVHEYSVFCYCMLPRSYVGVNEIKILTYLRQFLLYIYVIEYVKERLYKYGIYFMY